MLCKTNARYWCLDESKKLVLYIDEHKFKNRDTPYEEDLFISSGAARLLGPVCLGFWRG